MRVPNGVFAAKCSERWIGFRSPVTSAKPTTSDDATVLAIRSVRPTDRSSKNSVRSGRTGVVVVIGTSSPCDLWATERPQHGDQHYIDCRQRSQHADGRIDSKALDEQGAGRRRQRLHDQAGEGET